MAGITVDELQVLVTANTQQLQKSFGQVNSQLNDLERSAGKSSASMAKFGAVAGIAAAAAAKAVQMITNSIGAAAKRVDTLNNAPRILQNLGFSADDSARAIKQLDKGVLGLPTSLDAIVGSMTAITASSGLGIGAATQLTIAFNNMALAGGKGADDASRAFLQFEQALGRGAFQAQDFNTLMEVMPAQLNQVAKTLLGSSSNAMQLRTALTDGAVTMSDFVNAVIRLNSQGGSGFASFAQQAKDATGGLQTGWANVQTAIIRGLATIISALNAGNITSFFQGIVNAINAVIPYIAAFVRVFVSMVSIVTSAFGSIFGHSSKQAKAVSSDTASTAKSVSLASKGADGVASGLGSAAQSAKEITKQLAGFDEMNVLSSPKDASGGGGGGGGGLSVPDIQLPPIDTGNAKSAADKIKTIFDGIMNSSFVKGFKAFWENLGDGLKAVVGWIGKLIPKPVKDFFNTITQNKATKDILSGVATALGFLAGALTLGLIAFGAWNLIVGIASIVTGIFAGIMAVLTSPIVLVVASIGLLIAGIVLLVKNWDKVSAVAKAVWDGIVKVWQVVADWFEKNVAQPIGDALSGVWNWIKDNWPLLLAILTGPIGLAVLAIVKHWDDIKKAFKDAWEFIKEVWSAVAGWFGDVWDGIKKVFSSVGGWFKDIFQGAWNGITGIFSGLWSWFKTNVWDKIVGIFSSIGSSIGDAVSGAFKGVVNTAINFVTGFINTVIRAINGAIGIINKIPKVNISTISEVTLPKLATGGIVSKATTALIGEAGREAVLPLDRNTGWMDELAAKISGGNGGQHLTIKIGEDTIMDKIIGGINDRSFLNGGSVLTI